MNALDLELYAFAKKLIQARLIANQKSSLPNSVSTEIEDIKTGIVACERLGLQSINNINKRIISAEFYRDFLPYVGLFQPPGHKGP